MPKMSYAGCPGSSPAITAFKMSVQAENRKNAIKPPILGL